MGNAIHRIRGTSGLRIRWLLAYACLFVPAIRPILAQIPEGLDQHENFLRPSPETRLAAQVALNCHSSEGLSIRAVRDREATLQHTATVRRLDAEALVDLTCLRIRLGVSGAPAHEGYLMPSGTGWLSGAMNLVETNAADRGITAVAEINLYSALAMVTSALQPPAAFTFFRSRRESDRLPAGALEMLQRWTSAPVTPLSLMACSALALDTDQYEMAEGCSRHALALGVDSTWHLMRLAYIAARRDDPIMALKEMQDATAASRTPGERAIVGWHLEFRSVGFWEDTKVSFEDWNLTADEKGMWLAATPQEAVGLLDDRLEYLADRFNRQGPLDYLQAHFQAVIHSAADFRTCSIPMNSPRLCLRLRHVPRYMTPVRWYFSVARLWHEPDSALTMLVPYAIETRHLPDSSSDSINVVFDVEIIMDKSVRWRRQFSIRQFVGLERREGEYATGYLTLTEATLSAGMLRINLTVPGAEAALATTTMKQLHGDQVILSDVALSGTGSNLEWYRSDTTAVGLSPEASFASGDTVNVFVQALSEQEHAAVKFSLTLSRTGLRGSASQQPVLSWHARLARGLNALERLLVLPPLDEGRYHITFEVGTSDSLMSRSGVEFTID